MSEIEQCHNPDPRNRTTVNCCWNCRHKNKREDDHSVFFTLNNTYVCVKDGCIVSLFQVCKDWENDA